MGGRNLNKHGGYYGEDYRQVTDFSVNINPLGPSDYIKERIKEAIENIYRYPEIKGSSAIKALAKYMDLKEDHILLGNGAIELIYLFTRALQPKKAFILGPTFNEYRRAFQMNETKVIEISRIQNQEIHIDYNTLIERIYREKPDVFVLCNPNNPTGDYIPPKRFTPILEVIDEIGGWTMIDESFLDFTGRESFEKNIEKYNLFILRSMTKFYSLPGIRLGYGLGNKDLIQRLQKYKEPWSMNSIALDILSHVLKDEAFIQETLHWIHSERKFLYEGLKEIPTLKVFKPNANFILFRLEKGNPQNFFRYLLDNKIYLRTCEDFKDLGEEYFRVAVKTHKENKVLIDCIRKWK